MVKAISPNEVKAQKCVVVPDDIIEVFNALIVENYKASSASSKVLQDDVVRIACAKMNVSRHDIFDRGWLDVEPIFEKEGWKVTYHKASYGESEFDPYFIFEEKK